MTQRASDHCHETIPGNLLIICKTLVDLSNEVEQDEGSRIVDILRSIFGHFVILTHCGIDLSDKDQGNQNYTVYHRCTKDCLVPIHLTLPMFFLSVCL